MLNSDVLEVAIGLVFIYLLLSLIATSAREGLEGILKQRSKSLEAGLIELFDARSQPQLLQQFYDNPLINALYRGDYALPATLTGDFATAAATAKAARDAAVKHLPSYIPATSFALAALDLAVGKPAGAQPTAPPGSPPPSGDGTLTMAELQAAVSALPPGNFGDAMRLAAKTCQSITEVQSYLEAWFNAAMDRVSGLYKRRTQAMLFFLGLAICIVLNVNTLVIAQSLSQNQTLRAAVAADADGASKNPAFVRAITNDVEATNAINTQVDQIERVEGLPIGWVGTALSGLHGLFPHNANAGQVVIGLIELLAGWLITAFAITLGAPFWFDVLGKIMVIRSTVKPAEKSGVEASKDAAAPADTGS